MIQLENLLRDLRVASRSLKRTPLFAAIVVGTLAIGIGTNTAMFSVVDSILIQPLNYPAAERIALVGYTTPQNGSSIYGIRSDEYFAMIDGVSSFDAIGVYDYGGGTLTGDGGDPEEPTSLSINVSFQEILGLEPILGRPFTDEDTAEGANRVVMLGEELWRRRYNADPKLVGQTVLLDEIAHEVVGIVPDSFRFPDETGSFQVFRTRHLSRDVQWWSLGLVARLSPDSSYDQAAAELVSIGEGLTAVRPDTNTDRGFYTVPLKEYVTGDVRTSLLLLWSACAFVLLLACMNAANLLLARSVSKNHETAICAALGASRRRIVQQVLAESLLMAFVAAFLGLLIAQWGVEGITRLGLGDLPRGENIGLDARAFGFTLGLALLTGLLYGLLPAFQISRVNLAEMMKDGAGRGSSGRLSVRLRAALTVGQVAIACLLLIGAGLLIRSSMELRSTEPGFRSENVLGMTMWADQPRDTDNTWTLQFYDDVLRGIETVPGVRSASMVNNMPWQSMFDWSTPIQIENHPEFENNDPISVKYRIITHDYLEDLEVPLLAGRSLRPQDDTDSTAVAVVNRTFAERFWPDGNAVGQIVRVGENAKLHEVVGIVGDTREQRLDKAPVPTMYAPFRQNVQIAMTIMVSTEQDPIALQRSIQQEIWSVSPTQGIWNTRTLDSLLEASMARERLYLRLLAIFAVVAVLLAAVGIYGVISHSVIQRAREIGIRLALGAPTQKILRDVLVRGLRLSAIGLAVGLPLAWVMTRWIADMLYGVRALDPLTYVAVATLVAIVTLLACGIPALRAIRIPPAVSLRAE